MVFLLDDWLNAIDTGMAHLRLPDPNYVRPRGKAPWTTQELDTLIRNIDAEIDQEVTRAPGTSVGAKAGPCFHRLDLPQRLALAQHLEQMLEQYGDSLDRLEPLRIPVSIGET